MLVIFALFVAVAWANHPYRAENHFTCGMCKHSVRFVLDKNVHKAFKLCKDATGQEYTPVCRQVVSRASTILRHRNKHPKEICQRLGFCQMMLGEEQWNLPAINMTMINEINSGNHGWTAGVNKRFVKMTLRGVRVQLGAVVDPKHVYKLHEQAYSVAEQQAAPDSLDVRTQWPNCAAVSGDIRDQSACGSCWAFGSTEAYNDRNCISKNGQDTQLLSPADTNSCCGEIKCGSSGCNGGQPTAAWHWFKTSGVVSGGDYTDNGKSDTCEPYTFPPCAHHVNSPDYKPCPTAEYHTPACKHKCTNTGYAKGFETDKNKATQAYSLRSDANIMADMAKYGSATAAFTVYEDFLTYKSGVYRHRSGRALGGHAIKFLGYGVESGEKYWLVANSWNNEWGDKGTFKILRGVNECGIESDVSAGRA